MNHIRIGATEIFATNDDNGRFGVMLPAAPARSLAVEINGVVIYLEPDVAAELLSVLTNKIG